MTNQSSTQELIDLARQENEEEAYWQLIAKLHERGGIGEFKAASELCCSELPSEREIGADILGQLGWAKRNFHEESVCLLSDLLLDQDDDVVASAAYALGHRKAITAVPRLLALAEHQKQRVRHAVTFGLLGLDDAAAIGGLIRLSADADEEVRNWATFGLGSQINADSPAIRQALLARLGEENAEIAGEALLGLALRKEPRAIDLVKGALQRDRINGLVLQAAEALADPQLLPLLEVWRNRGDDLADGYFQGLLDAAWRACCGRREDTARQEAGK